MARAVLPFFPRLVVSRVTGAVVPAGDPVRVGLGPGSADAVCEAGSPRPWAAAGVPASGARGSGTSFPRCVVLKPIFDCGPSMVSTVIAEVFEIFKQPEESYRDFKTLRSLPL